MRSEQAVELGQVLPFKYRNPTGLSDILPEAQRYLYTSEEQIIKTASSFGYRRLIMPPVEARSLYTIAFGNRLDALLIGAEIEQDGESYVFSAHPRVSALRSYKENGLSSWPPPVHLWYQTRTLTRTADSYAQHHYLCLDVLGAHHSTTSASQLFLMSHLARELAVRNPTLVIHSNGCPECRPSYNELLKKRFAEHADAVCQDCAEQLTLEQVLACDTDKDAQWIMDLPVFVDHICPQCHAQLTEILELCDQLHLAYDLNNHFFARYDEAEQTIFGLRIGNELHPAITGFHFDRFATALVEEPLSALGITIDLEQLNADLERQHTTLPTDDSIQVFIAQLGAQAKAQCVPLLQELFNAGYYVATACESESITQQLQVAERLHAQVTLIIGQKEAVNGHVIMRDMNSGLQDNVFMEDLIPTLQERLTVL